MTALNHALRPRRRWPVPAALVLMLAFISGALSAQPVRGTLTDSTRSVPVAGVVVTLLDAGGSLVARTLSSERGLYFFPTRGIASSLHVQRIGYRAQTLPLPKAVDEITTLNVVMAKLPTLLAPMKVADKGCPRRSDEGSAISLLEQARTGLLAAVVASKEKPSVQTSVRFDRVMSDDGNRILRQSVHLDSGNLKTSSFESAHSAIDYVRNGFAETVEGETTFHAPDADVLLNDDFVAAYCFKLAKSEGNRVNQVGLAFNPAKTMRNRVDVEGALWIDTVARAIKEIEFRYKGLARSFEDLKPGGTIGFREMTSGVVLIDRWTLRLVGVEPAIMQTASGPTLVRTHLTITETGGELAKAVWPDGFTWNAPLGVLTVHASDAKQLPAVGTTLRLAHTNYEGVTDSVGTLRFDKLVPGPYQLMVVDPRLSTIDVDIETPVKIVAKRDSAYTASIRIPSAIDYVAKECGSGGRFTDSLKAAWVAGKIVAGGKHPVDSLEIKISREVAPQVWQAVDQFYTTGTNGLFFICSDQLRAQTPVRLEIRKNRKLLTTLSGMLVAFLTILKIPITFE